MFREFLIWWLHQLGDLLPDGWRRRGAHAADAVIIDPATALAECLDVTISLRRGGRETTLGRFRLDDDGLAPIPAIAGRPAVLRLAADQVLGKTLLLPLAAERRLAQVLAFEMERETPFSPDEVLWSHRVARRDRRTGKVWVRLVLVPRARLAPLLAALGQSGIRPARAEIAAGPDQGSVLPLVADGRAFGYRPHRQLRRAALATCLVLAVAAAGFPFVRQSVALAGIESEIAADRAAAARAQALRQEADLLAGNAELVEVERNAGGRPLATLAALTRQLPPDTFLTDFSQQLRKVTLTGRSAAASRLIALLAEGGRLRNPAFAAPVTRDAAEQSDLFTITAEIVP